MKKTLLLFFATGITYLTLTGYASGPGLSPNNLNRTGGPGSGGLTCAESGCHGSSSANTTILWTQVFDNTTNTDVTSSNKYIASHNYTITISGINALIGPNVKFGFQIMPLDAAGNSAGTMSHPDPNVAHVVSVGGKNILEHSQPGGSSAGMSVSFNWIPGSSTQGNVTFYAIMNAVNSNNQADAGDHPSVAFTKVLSEQPASVADLSKDILISAYPNPVIDKFTISFNDAVNGEYTVTVMDVTGRKMHTQSVQVTGSKATASVESAGWSSGLYFAQVVKDGAQRMLPIVKK